MGTRRRGQPAKNQNLGVTQLLSSPSKYRPPRPFAHFLSHHRHGRFHEFHPHATSVTRKATQSRWPASAHKCKDLRRSELAPAGGDCLPEWNGRLTRACDSANSTNLVIILGVMQLAKRIPFEDPFVLNACRAGYALSNLIILGIYLWTKIVIDKKKGKLLAVISWGLPPSGIIFATANTHRADLTTLKYVEPAPMGSSEEGKLVTTTIHAYDAGQLKALMRSQMMGVAMMGVMHLYFKYTNPLLIQSIIPLKGALEANLVKIHIWGQPAAGDLKRPFKAAAGFMQGLQSGPAQSDKKAVEAAERAGRGGAKEE